jgi:hypothetical protein
LREHDIRFETRFYRIYSEIASVALSGSVKNNMSISGCTRVNMMGVPFLALRGVAVAVVERVAETRTSG